MEKNDAKSAWKFWTQNLRYHRRYPDPDQLHCIRNAISGICTLIELRR